MTDSFGTDSSGGDAWDDEDRAIARALGAEIPDHDAFTVDSDAVADYEAVLAALPFREVAPRAGLEDDVVAAALSRRPEAATAIDGRQARRRHVPARNVPARNVSGRWIAIGGAATAAAVVAVILAVSSMSTGVSGPAGRIAPAASTVSVAQVLAEPGTRTAALRTDRNVVVGRVALGSDGEGFLYDLKPSQAGTARWLWLDLSGDRSPVGRFTGTTVHFVVKGDVHDVTGVIVMPTPTLSSAPGRADARFERAR